jgi:hypothetical protein
MFKGRYLVVVVFVYLLWLFVFSILMTWALSLRGVGLEHSLYDRWLYVILSYPAFRVVYVFFAVVFVVDFLMKRRKLFENKEK